MMIAGLVIASLLVFTFFFIRQEKFGKAPEGERLKRMQQSPNFREGKFQNQSPTPDLTEGHSMLGVAYEYFFARVPRKRPTDSIPSMKTNLQNLSPDENVLIWFGHSSCFIQLDGKRFLIDPVFSGNASPVGGMNTAFKGTDIYAVEELPDIDYLLITHDHYDHLDHETVLKLKSKTAKVICGLGVGSHLEYWGFKPEVIIERDWHESVAIDSNFSVHLMPARHFSGRLFSRNNTLWCSFVLQSPGKRIFIGGDSGYDKHFKEIGEKYGPFDLALLDNGQYNKAWQLIHAMPEETMQAAKDLQTKRVLPVHSAKFMMANHPWDEPLKRITELSQNSGIPLVTPMIGEKVNLSDEQQQFRQWWLGIN